MEFAYPMDQSMDQSAEATVLDRYVEHLRATVADLWYPSEADSPLTVVVWPVERLDEATVVAQLGGEVSPVEPRPVEDFFRPVVTSPFWRTPQGEHLGQRYEALRQLLTDTLTDLHLYRVGRVEVTVYLMGRHPGGGYVGLKTTVVET
jgi:hypothetical protein